MPFFVIFRQILGGFCIVGDFWVLRDHTYPARKMKNNQSVKGSTGAHQTSAHNFRVYLSKTVWTFERLCS